MKPHNIAALLITATALLAGPATARAETRGVTKDEILLGTLLDLSGPAAGPGKELRNGMLMRIDEVNEAGGINGRKLRLLAEDHGFDPKRAVLGAEKLTTRDRVFTIVGQFGSSTTLATLPLLARSNTINFFPMTSSRQTFDPASPLKFAFHPPDYDQIRTALPVLIKEKGLSRVCAIYQDDELGQEITRGAEVALQALNTRLVEKLSFKRGATDFSSQVARAKASNCDGIVLATVVRETVGVMSEAAKLGFEPAFVGTSTAYSQVIPRLGGRNVEGLYATMHTEEPYLDSPNKPLREWAGRYKAKFSEDATVYSSYGYVIVDSFIRTAQAAGSDLSTESFGKTLYAKGLPASFFGPPAMSFSPTKSLGHETVRLSQVKDGRWQVVLDYEQMKR